MISESLRNLAVACTSLKKWRMYDTYSSRAYHSGRECKESLAFIFIRQRCLHFRMQTGGGCLVVKLASLVGSCGAYQPMPPTWTNQCFDWKGHTSNTTSSCPHYLCLHCLGPTGLHESTRWESTHDLDSNHVSSWYEIITEPSSVECGILLTYADHVGASLGRWSFRRGT